MAYNHIYNLQFKGLDQVGTNFFYKVKFEKYEATTVVYDVIELIPAQDSAFVLNYKSIEDNIFSPIRSSYVDIKCFIPYDSLVQPSDFFFDNDEYSLRVSFYESDGTSDILKWRGFLLPDVIQYEWQEQYYLQLTATDNLSILKDIKYTRADYYALYNETSVADGINVTDFICRLLKKTGSELNVAVYAQFQINGVLTYLESLKLSEYSSVDWNTFEPKDCYFLLTNLIRSLGCVLYQSNTNATWNVISINDVAVNDIITDGGFSVDSALPGQLYEYWTISGDVVNSETGGINGTQCPRIKGDNASYVRQFINTNSIEYIVGFYAKNDSDLSPPAVVRVVIDGMEVYTTPISNGWNYYEFVYTSGGGSFNLDFYNNNDDSIGYMSLDNVTFKQKNQIAYLYDINGAYISSIALDLYSSIGNAGNVKWSDVNQIVSLNKRLTNVQFNYPFYERNLIENYGFFKNYLTTSTTPTNWEVQNLFSFANATGENRPFDNRILSVKENESVSGGLTLDKYMFSTFRITNSNPFFNFFAIKIECAIYFDDSHTDGDGINIAFVKSKDGQPSNFPTRYLDSTGTYYSVVTSPLWNAVYRIPVFMSEKNKWMKFKCLSTFDQNNSNNTGNTLYDYGTLILRPQRSYGTATPHQTYFDDLKVSIIPQGYKNTKGFIYNATNIPNDSTLTKPFSNTYKIDKGQYHGGISNKFESQVIEDFIGYIPDGETTIFNSDKWLRTWETYGYPLGRPLEECITRSILSFYQNTWQKFTGNVYGKNISFGQVFNIALADGLHFMHEASFDYVSNKTNITTHQSQSDKLETGFRSWSTTKEDTGAGQGQPGSSTSSIQQEGE